MAITQSVNSKANIKKFSNEDLPFSPKQPVISSYYATSTTAQTVINLSFSVDQSLTDQFFLFVDGKKLRLGASNDFTFTSIGSDNTSSQVTLNSALSVNLNIQAYMLGLKAESEFQTDNRFVQLYAAQNSGFQGFVDQSTLMTPTTVTGTPAAGTFYSSIPNRASMVDLSQNLKAQMGIERQMIQTAFVIQNEAGPSGEQVSGATGDLFGQVRYVGGNWSFGSINAATTGPNTSGNTTDYVEVTFYGTGLNAITDISNNARDIRASIDGQTEGVTNLIPTVNGLTAARNYQFNVNFNIVKGLTLGVHTVKMRNNNSTGGFTFGGYEVINESGNIIVNPGVSYNQGKKYSSAAASTFAYNSVATGTRGGRIVVYQNADGSIGKSWQAAATLASSYSFAGTGYSGGTADHTNEEVVRRYQFREFGAGRTDDFSFLSATSSRAFTLDDGITTLVGNNVSAGIGASPQPEGMGPNASGSTANIQFTFIGTGVDIVNVRGAALTTNYDVSIDNVAVATNVAGSTLFGNGSGNIVKIASGLPYGTHVLRIAVNGTIGNGLLLSHFIVYQPKKPAIASGAVEIADYNVLGNYTANSTAAQDATPPGVMRKFSTREASYVGTWSSTQTTTSDPGGWQIGNSVNGDFLNFYFFGTGFEWRFASSTAVGTMNVTVDGVANLTGTLGATTSFYGTQVTSFVGTTGVITVGSGLGNAQGIQVSGLALGMHTVKIAKSSAGAMVWASTAFDVITPIHSAKSNQYVSQNTLPIGSNAISDNRKVTPVKDVLVNSKAWAQAVGIASGPTTTSTSAVPCPDMSVSIKTSGGSVDISYVLEFTMAAGSQTLFAAIYVNGNQVGFNKAMVSAGASASLIISDRQIVVLGAGTHKIDVYWSVSSGTATAPSTRRCLVVKEN